MTTNGGLTYAVPEWRIGNRQWGTYRLAGHLGLLLALAIAIPLARHRGVSPVLTAVLVAGGYPTIVALTLLRRIVTGRERLAFFHLAIAYSLLVGLVLAATGQPVLAYVDIVVVGVMAFLAVGRLGCFATGCCYGRPQQRGVAYGEPHVRAGLPRSLLGVHLFPFQLWDSGLAIAVAGAGVATILLDAAVGSALAICTVLYAAGRFGLEFFRGEPHRLYLGGLSEAQLICVGLCATFGTLLLFGGLGPTPWLGMVAVLVVLGAFARALHERLHPELVSTLDLSEVAELLAPWRSIEKSLPPGTQTVVSVDGGLMVSARALPGNGREVGVVSFSRRGRALRRQDAKRLGALTRALSGAPHTRTVTSPAGVVHVLAENTSEQTGRTDAV